MIVLYIIGLIALFAIGYTVSHFLIKKGVKKERLEYQAKRKRCKLYVGECLKKRSSKVEVVRSKGKVKVFRVG